MGLSLSDLNPFKPAKKALKKIAKPFRKISQKFIPKELRWAAPYLAAVAPYSSFMMPGSGILSSGLGRSALAGLYNLGGLGLSWQSNYDGNGFLIGLSSGASFGEVAFNCISSSYQWRLGNISNYFYFSLGISSYSTQYYNKVLEEDIKRHEYFPVISLDRRF